MKWQKWLSICLSVIALLCILFVALVGVFDIQVFTLESTSMEPTIREGSMILNKKEEFQEIEVNDIITYKEKDANMYVTHRVQERDMNKKRLLCKGDANAIEDGYIDYESQYHSTLLWNIPFMGSVLSFFHGEWGQSISVIIILVLIAALSYEIYQNKVE